MKYSQRLVATTVGIVLVAGMVVVATPASAAPTAAPTKTYKACANKHTGEIRLVIKGKRCKKGELKLVWNAQGPVGPTGSTGATGATGATGPTGAPGLDALPLYWLAAYASVMVNPGRHSFLLGCPLELLPVGVLLGPTGFGEVTILDTRTQWAVVPDPLISVTISSTAVQGQYVELTVMCTEWDYAAGGTATVFPVS